MASTAPGSARQLNFTNLPLQEAAVRASFDRPVPLTFEVIDQIRDRLRVRFPRVSEPSQLELPPGVPAELGFGPGHVQGVVFINDIQGLRLTVQAQLVAARWEKQILEDGSDYPRFQVLRDALWEGVAAFAAANGLGELPVAVVNMSYVNLIDVNEPSSVLRRYFSSGVQVQAMCAAKQVRKLEIAWQEGDDVDLRMSVDQVRMTRGVGTRDGYRVTTAAGKRVAPPTDARDALDAVHDRLQLFFSSAISESAKQEWGLQQERGSG